MNNSIYVILKNNERETISIFFVSEKEHFMSPSVMTANPPTIRLIHFLIFACINFMSDPRFVVQEVRRTLIFVTSMIDDTVKTSV